MKATRDNTITQMRQATGKIAAYTKSRASEYDGLARNLMIPKDSIPAMRAAHRSETATKLQPLFQQLHALRDGFHADNVMQGSPDFSSPSAPKASSVAAVMANATAYSPRVFARLLNDAAKRNDLALVSAMLPVGESLQEYSRPFVASPEMGAAIVAGQQALRTPDVLASEEAAQFASTLDIEIKALELVTASDHPDQSLGLHLQTQSFPNILPSA